MSTASIHIAQLLAPLDARVRVPGSKSYTNRALVLAALAQGTSTLQEALFSDDTVYMARALADLGVAVQEDRDARRFVVKGCGGIIPRVQARVEVGNSGTTARFLTAVMALGDGSYELDGNAAMRTRPIGPLLAALRDLGADAVSLLGNECPPVRVSGHGLRGGVTRVPGTVSSQYLSALLLCGPATRDGILVEIEGDLVSKPYLDMTLQAMATFGARGTHDGYRRFRVDGGQRYHAIDYAIEPDASAASYFFAAAAITAGRVVVDGLGTESLQGDLGFVRVLEQMGCSVHQTATRTELRGTSSLRGVEVDMRNLSDTAQTLAAVAPFANSPTRITGIGFIRRKETDRIAAVVRELRRIGIDAVEEPDGMTIRPGAIHPATIETYDDHRMAMSFALIGLRSPGIVISEPDCVTKTFPDFFEVLETLPHGGNAP